MLKIKDRIDHGRFVHLVEHDCGMSIRAAQRAMTVARLVGKNDKLSYLPQDGLVALSSKAATPILDQIIARIDAGERPSATAIKDEIAASKKQPAEVKLAARQRQQRPEQPEQELRGRDCRGAGADRTTAAVAAASMLVACLGVHLPDFLSLAEKASASEIFDILRQPEKLTPVNSEPSDEAPIGEACDRPPLRFPIAVEPAADAAAIV